MTTKIWKVPLVDVALPVPDTEPLTYRLLKPQYETAVVGRVVQVPLKSRKVHGVIIDVRRGKPVPGLKSVAYVRAGVPPLPENILQFTKWISEYYLCSWGEALKAALPAGLLAPVKVMVIPAFDLADRGPISGKDLDPRWMTILEELRLKSPRTLKSLSDAIGVRSIKHVISTMKEAGLLEIHEVAESVGKPLYKEWFRLTETAVVLGKQVWEETLCHAPKQLRIMEALENAPEGLTWEDLIALTGVSRSSLKGLMQKGWVESWLREDTVEYFQDDITEELPGFNAFTKEQRGALKVISQVISGEIERKPILLFGCTGSGKTLLYIEAIRQVLGKGQSALVLVPEISLTPQTVRRFRSVFGDKVAVQHSGLAPRERAILWRNIFQGKYPVVVGARSAVFAPLPNLGLIVVDEEHSPTFKQFDPAPRYQARDAAIMRAKMEQAVVILGSATPSLESFFHAQEGKYQLLELSSRADGVLMPEVRIIDRTKKSEFEVSSGAFTSQLVQAISQSVQKNEQVILLQNRRGYSTFIQCRDCGMVEQCPHCTISLTYHKRGNRLRCHYCGYSEIAPTTCSKCHGFRLDYAGTGTERVEEELEGVLPGLKIARMDLDTTSGRGSHQRILNAFQRGGYNILLGTQMVAKGLDMPRVTLVGIISADTELFLPDFRAAERTFALLTQAAGRAGRRDKQGLVIIQTYHPLNPVLPSVITHDYQAFYDGEILTRQELEYPPFSRLALIRFQGKVEIEVLKAAERFAELLKERIGPLEIMGPAPATIVRAKDQYIYQILVKSPRDQDHAGEHLRHAVQLSKQAYMALDFPKKVAVVIDIDPMGFA
jgi:primosomal protein N' (replication factor Y)